MPRHLFLMLMEQAACTRFVEAHHAAITCAMSAWRPSAPSLHGDRYRIKLEELRERADKEKQRHLRWLNLRRAHAGLPAVEDA
ncbi:MAG TPA: hypothetical protein VG758_05540 [Hyphomicrobiaceae bacterium]|jgi:hypothetical protein|nr:hypothetical protein [Hyphomicrobiaceae bacterium]